MSATPPSQDCPLLFYFSYSRNFASCITFMHVLVTCKGSLVHRSRRIWIWDPLLNWKYDQHIFVTPYLGLILVPSCSILFHNLVQLAAILDYNRSASPEQVIQKIATKQNPLADKTRSRHDLWRLGSIEIVGTGGSILCRMS